MIPYTKGLHDFGNGSHGATLRRQGCYLLMS